MYTILGLCISEYFFFSGVVCAKNSFTLLSKCVIINATRHQTIFIWPIISMIRISIIGFQGAWGPFRTQLFFFLIWTPTGIHFLLLHDEIEDESDIIFK